MIEYKEQLKLQAYLDGELSEAERRTTAELLARDAEAAALLAELRETRGAVAAYGQELRLPASREFYWSKIQREIERLETRDAAAVPKAAVSWLGLLRRALVPAAAVAVVLIAGLLVTRPGSTPGTETSIADSGAFTYHDYDAGATLVWLSYPAERQIPDDYEAAMFE
jgi:anti-sigma factor RsiW